MPNILIGTNVDLKLDDVGGTERNLTTFWISGHPEILDESVDVTVFGDTARRNRPGLESANFTVGFQMDSTGAASPWVVLTGLLASNTTASTIRYYPEGDSSGRPEILLQARCIALRPGGGIGEVGVFEAEFVVDGTRTVGTV